MSASEGLRIVSVTKALEAYQRGDSTISRYFGATLLAGHTGLLLSSLRNQTRLPWDKFVVHAANAHIDSITLRTHVVPRLVAEGFIELGASDKPTVSCNVIDYDAILRATSKLFNSLEPTSEERIVLSLFDLGIQFPTTRSDAMNKLAGESEQQVETALDLAKGYKIVKVLEGRSLRDPIIYSPLIWGDNIAKAGQALSNLDGNRRALVVELINMVRKYQGLPEATARQWAEQNGDTKVIEFAVGLGMLDRTEIVSKDGGSNRFLTTPHLYGEIAANHGRDVCDRIRLFLDSIRHGQHYGRWHTGKITDPVRLLSKLIDAHEIGPCTAIGNDYILVEKAGIVNVKPSSYKAGQFTMHLVQKDTVGLIRDMLVQAEPPNGLGMYSNLKTVSQDRFVSSEQARGSIGQLPEPMVQAEAEILRNLREMI
jgi:hypothetical protein